MINEEARGMPGPSRAQIAAECAAFSAAMAAAGPGVPLGTLPRPAGQGTATAAVALPGHEETVPLSTSEA